MSSPSLTPPLSSSPITNIIIEDMDENPTPFETPRTYDQSSDHSPNPGVVDATPGDASDSDDSANLPPHSPPSFPPTSPMARYVAPSSSGSPSRPSSASNLSSPEPTPPRRPPPVKKKAGVKDFAAWGE